MYIVKTTVICTVFNLTHSQFNDNLFFLPRYKEISLLIFVTFVQSMYDIKLSVSDISA